MRPINFTGIFIKKSPIIHNDKNGEHKKDVSFIELEKNNAKDMDALETIGIEWGDDSYASMIYENTLTDYSESMDNIKEHVYILTKQISDFDNINSDDILGAALFREKDTPNKIELLQTNPKYIKKNHSDSEYSQTGSSIIESLKIIHGDKPIECFAVQEAIPFYEKNGFVHNDKYKNNNSLIWYG